jgi:hypothetical protein
MKTAVATLIVFLMLGPLVPTRARADTQAVVDKTYDALILRPMSGFALVVGSVLFIPAVMMGAMNGPDGMSETWETFVARPYEATVDRELGEF